ncbi:MAG: cytidylate kinase [Cocleimonas sp.]
MRFLIYKNKTLVKWGGVFLSILLKPIQGIEMNKQSQVIPVITIDGPAGSGKGTISQRVADQLGWHILDSGALYRLVGLSAQLKKVELDDEFALAKVAQELDVVFKSNDEGAVTIFLDNNDVTLDIRTEEAGSAASQVAAKPSVRKALLERQQRFQTSPGLVADGRDMGTVVFREAPIKIFLTASAEIRAKRRLNQLKQQGISANLRGLISDIEKRDARDTNRKDAPLIPATDATIINTDEMGINEVVDKVLTVVKRVLPKVL